MRLFLVGTLGLDRQFRRHDCCVGDARELVRSLSRSKFVVAEEFEVLCGLSRVCADCKRLYPFGMASWRR